MKDAASVVAADLQYIIDSLGEELGCMAGKRLLITGGAGFLGYYLAQSILHWNRREALGQRIDLTVFDNFVRGVPAWLATLAADEELRLVRHDITRPVPDKIGDFQYIVHAASIASPKFYRRYPIETMDANVTGLRNLLEYSRQHGSGDGSVQGFLFFSSSEIYGDPTPDNIPTPEEYRGNVSCTGPRACYDEAKRFGETLCVNFASQYGLPIRIVRPFNNYGPGLRLSDGRVIPDFARDVLSGRDIIMLSDGSPTRTFCYVADAIVGYYKTLVRGRTAEPYNVGTEAPEISMVELAEQVAALAASLFKYGGRVVRESGGSRDYLADNPARRCPVIAKARAELGYNPSVTLEDGLRRSLIWYHENRD